MTIVKKADFKTARIYVEGKRYSGLIIGKSTIKDAPELYLVRSEEAGVEYNAPYCNFYCTTIEGLPEYCKFASKASTISEKEMRVLNRKNNKTLVAVVRRIPTSAENSDLTHVNVCCAK